LIADATNQNVVLCGTRHLRGASLPEIEINATSHAVLTKGVAREHACTEAGRALWASAYPGKTWLWARSRCTGPDQPRNTASSVHDKRSHSVGCDKRRNNANAVFGVLPRHYSSRT